MTINTSARFTNATAFYINAPLLADELEIEQVESSIESQTDKLIYLED